MQPLPSPPPVAAAELRLRLANMRREMAADNLDWLVLTDRKNIGYFTDYRTLTWAYHSRPLLCLIGQSDFILIASRTETRNLAQAPHPFKVRFYDGYELEAVAACQDTIRKSHRGGSARVALDHGQDMFGRGSIALSEMVGGFARNATAISGVAAIWRVRMIKSELEVGLKRQSFDIVNAAFDDAIAAAKIGMSERELCSDVQARILRNGADQSDAIAMTFDRGDFIYNRPPSDRLLQADDYIWTDFRSPYGGYPADRNRIARAGEPEPWEETAYETVRTLTIEVARSIRPGMLCRDVYDTYKKLWAEAKLPQPYGLISRIGHGGGLDVTEPPSLSATDLTVIMPGMVLHLEPKLELEGAVFQFEEIVHVREGGADFISTLSPQSLPVIAG